MSPFHDLEIPHFVRNDNLIIINKEEAAICNGSLIYPYPQLQIAASSFHTINNLSFRTK